MPKQKRYTRSNTRIDSNTVFIHLLKMHWPDMMLYWWVAQPPAVLQKWYCYFLYVPFKCGIATLSIITITDCNSPFCMQVTHSRKKHNTHINHSTYCKKFYLWPPMVCSVSGKIFSQFADIILVKKRKEKKKGISKSIANSRQYKLSDTTTV